MTLTCRMSHPQWELGSDSKSVDPSLPHRRGRLNEEVVSHKELPKKLHDVIKPSTILTLLHRNLLHVTFVLYQTRRILTS